MFAVATAIKEKTKKEVKPDIRSLVTQKINMVCHQYFE
jgi:hypothetical protein